ncbi:YolD-like family protein [Cohnella nanjingensis]|uniref:YolD-like family protein n=1 Tax=Cohnella nanjingensis TaxID=1387779 RepID=A0A7X0RXZ9_9BACL|nr:YolD-like family protein [Cohnella nanjingensis]MBB6674551.1 YolD-like family protein [Cohnella nanjingensis]
MPPVSKPGKKNKIKRPTRDEFELEELGERLVEAQQEKSEVALTVWGVEEAVRGTIVKMDARTRLVHVQSFGEVTKVPFMDIMRVNHGYDS